MTRTTESGPRRVPSRARSAQQRGPRRSVAVGVALVVVVVASGGTALATGVVGKHGHAGPGTAGGGYRTSTATVTRRSLTSQSVVNATLGDAGTWTVAMPQSSSSSSSSPAGGSGSGTFTWLPTVGNTIRQGHVIYQVSGRPAVLLYGNVPAYRDLSEGLTGPDVTELNKDLVKLGYATAAALGRGAGGITTAPRPRTRSSCCRPSWA